jgi:hypothetical protein
MTIFVRRIRPAENVHWLAMDCSCASPDAVQNFGAVRSVAAAAGTA